MVLLPNKDNAVPSLDVNTDQSGRIEVAVVGDLTDNAVDIVDKLLAIETGSDCTIYFDSPGGNPYTANSLVTIMRLRGLQATGVVTGECSSAAVWPFAACHRRLVTASSVLLFHPMKWQSEEQVGIAEAAEWSRHFASLEIEMDNLLINLFGAEQDARIANLIREWCRQHRYVTGRQIAEVGLAELIDLQPLAALRK